MLFNSFGFIFLFLPTVFGVWYVLQRSNIRVANMFLILVSLGFYATLDAKHLPLLLFSVVVNFLLGMRLQRAVDGCVEERGREGLPRFEIAASALPPRNDGKEKERDCRASLAMTEQGQERKIAALKSRLPRFARNDDGSRNDGEKERDCRALRLPRRLCLLAMTGWRDCRASLAMTGWSNDAKVLLVLAVVFNLALLGSSKYIVGFSVLSALGISFFTFHQLAYHVDIYRGKFRASGFLEYLLFVAFFPHMIAGPIVRPAQFMPQLAENGFRKSKIAMGVMFFSIGLFKKTVFADGAAKIADRVFEGSAGVGFFEAWSGVLAYGMQIYFDFSGYADMAIGVGLLFGIYLPLNFKNPYKATSMIEFWRRWHITLSDFVRDYLYIPLGGNRHGKFRQGVAILVAMTLIGVWHGSAWSFVAWGFLHGAALWVNHLIRGVLGERKREREKEKEGLPRFARNDEREARNGDVSYGDGERLPNLSLRGFSRGNLNDGIRERLPRFARNDEREARDDREEARNGDVGCDDGKRLPRFARNDGGVTVADEIAASAMPPCNDGERDCRASLAMTMWGVKAGGFVMTFTTVTLLWVLFRSESFEAAIGFYKKLFLFDKNIALFEGWWMLVLGYAVIFFGRSAAEIVGYGMDRRACHCEALAVAISMTEQERDCRASLAMTERVAMTEKKLGVMDGVLVGVVLFLAFKMMMGEPSRSFVYFVF